MTYQIDWPPGFVSRTSDPADPCFIGKIGDTANRVHAPSDRSVILLSKGSRLGGKTMIPEMMKRPHRKKYTP